MTKQMEDLFCYWYANEKKASILAFFSLGNSLSELALSADEKETTISDCMYCELVIPYFIAEESFLKNCQQDVDTQLSSLITELSKAIENLSSKESECFSREIFRFPSWQRISSMATIALGLLDWSSILTYEKDWLDWD